MDFAVFTVIDGDVAFNTYFSTVFWVGFLGWNLGMLLRILNRS